MNKRFNDKPILIIGPPRSGTTLLATMLNSHSRIFVANEAKVFVRLLPNVLKKSLKIDINLAREIIGGLESNELYYLKPLPAANEVLEEDAFLSPSIFIRRLFKKIAEHEGKVRWGEKTAVAYRHVSLIRDCFPDAVFLGLDREPYEIAASYIKVNPKWGALGAIVHWLDFRRAIFSQGADFDYLMVSYRVLVTDPESTLAGICERIGEPYENNMLRFYDSDRARALSVDATFNGASKPLYSTSEPPEKLHSGFTGYLISHLISADPLREPVQRRLCLIFPVLKVWVYARAFLWEIFNRNK